MRIAFAAAIIAAAPALEDTLARFEAGAADALRGNAACLAGSRRQWESARERCKDATCVERAYRERLAELALLQPGMNLRGDLELPVVAQLIGALAPEADRVMAPPIASRPGSVAGELLYDERQGAFVIRERPGRQAIVLLDIMRSGDNAVQLPVMAEVHKGAKVSARGRLAVKDGGTPYFDRRHCVLLHRLPG